MVGPGKRKETLEPYISDEELGGDWFWERNLRRITVSPALPEDSAVHLVGLNIVQVGHQWLGRCRLLVFRLEIVGMENQEA